jgi:hypothetical protein
MNFRLFFLFEPRFLAQFNWYIVKKLKFNWYDTSYENCDSKMFTTLNSNVDVILKRYSLSSYIYFLESFLRFCLKISPHK